jgi:hypothetical protein
VQGKRLIFNKAQEERLSLTNRREKACLFIKAGKKTVSQKTQGENLILTKPRGERLILNTAQGERLNLATHRVQAEDRAHRRGQLSAVNVYLFCAKDTEDETNWLRLSESLEQVTTVVNGSEDAVKGIHVDSVEDRASGQKLRTADEETNDWGATQWEGGAEIGVNEAPEADGQGGGADIDTKTESPGVMEEPEGHGVDVDMTGKLSLGKRDEGTGKEEKSAEPTEDRDKKSKACNVTGENREKDVHRSDCSNKGVGTAEGQLSGEGWDKVHVLSPRGVRRRSFPGDGQNSDPPEKGRSEKRARKSLFPSSQGAVFDVFIRAGGGVKAEEMQGEDDGGVPAGKLLFEISKNTGRVHLYRGGKNGASGGGAPELLGVNFQQEELAKLKTEEDIRYERVFRVWVCGRRWCAMKAQQ